MVKTRHSLDACDDQPREFLSLRTLRSRDARSQDLKSYGSDSGRFREQRYLTRHQTVASYEELDSSIDNLTRRPIRNRSMRKPVDQDISDVSRQEEHPPDLLLNDHEDDPDHDQDGGIRRSSRHRKLLYDSFKQSLMLNTHYPNGTLNNTSSPDVPDEGQHRKKRRRELEDLDPAEASVDMYTRVKRERKKVNKDMYGMPIHEDKSSEEEDSEEETDEDEESDDEDNEEEEEEEKTERPSYNLREYKPRTEFYEAPKAQRRLKKNDMDIFRQSSPPPSPARRKNSRRRSAYKSPAQRSPSFKRRRARAAFHDSSETSSSGSPSGGDSSDDEARFQRRKAKSMARSRMRILPMNLAPDEAAKSGTLRDRQKIGASLADVDPMNIDKSVTFDSVGGLGKHVRSLKEMVVFPLLYPEVFERFKIAPPRGVLFHGPPGTGKTLVARALANECSSGEKRVSFFMRKGADCLSKWVGESERQLRLLFDQAYQMRPSIIFFDEIDGLAPVRSSRQDQIHSSIVSTLLALMDGLDSRGEIVIIGATNRIDSIDPALRRPGRFDREFLFPLPTVEARAQILKIHTTEWNPKLSDTFVKEVAEKCVGYCGADVKALCTEAALLALRRRYPQIYTSKDKLSLDITSINISGRDFHRAMQSIIPAAQRSVASPGRALSHVIQPLLVSTFNHVKSVLEQIFPSALAQLSNLDTKALEENNALPGEALSDSDDEGPSIYDESTRGRKKKNTEQSLDSTFLTFSSLASRQPSTHRPRLLLTGDLGQGQSSHIGPAVLHYLEKMPVHVLDLATLFANSARTPEESCAQVFREAKRTSPSIVYLPHLNQWWDVLGETLRATFITMLYDIEPTSPVLLLATSERQHIPNQVQSLFYSDNIIAMHNPSEVERKEFFRDLLLNQATKPPTRKVKAAIHALEVLPKAPPQEPRKMTNSELRRLHAQEEGTLRELRIFLREILNKLARDKKFYIFTKPVDMEDVPDYLEIIKAPMDLSHMMTKIDRHMYQCSDQFVADINLICSNALEYNPPKDQAGRAIRHRACALKDTCHAIIDNELDPEFDQMCKDIVESRKRRGEDPSKTAPDFLVTKPVEPKNRSLANLSISSSGDIEGQPTRFSRRTRGLVVETPPDTSSTNVPVQNKEEKTTDSHDIVFASIHGAPKPIVQNRQITENVVVGTPLSSKPKKKNVSIWCKPTRRGRKRRRNTFPRNTTPTSHNERTENADNETIKLDEGSDVDLSNMEDDSMTHHDTTDNIEHFSDLETKQEVLAAENSNCDTKDSNAASQSVCTDNASVDTHSEHISKVLNIVETSNDSGMGGSTNQTPENSDKVVEVAMVTNQEEDTKEKEEVVPMIHLTRARTATVESQQAADILNEVVPTFIVDVDRIRHLLEVTVETTSEFTTEKLEQLYSRISQAIYLHKNLYDKTALVEEMERIVKASVLTR